MKQDEVEALEASYRSAARGMELAGSRIELTASGRRFLARVARIEREGRGFVGVS